MKKGGANPRGALIVALIALATDGLLYGLAVPVLPLLADEQGASSVGVGALFAAYAAALVVATPIAGVAVDRAGTRTPMLAGLVCLAGATGLLAIVDAPTLLLAARALQGAAAGVTWTASLALIAQTHDPEARGQAMGLALSAVGAGILLGPPLGGLLADGFGTHAPFVFGAAVAGADAVARWTLLPAARPLTRAERPPAVRRRRDLLQVAAVTALGAALIAFLEPILPLHARDSLNLGRSGIGLLFGASAAAAIVGPPVVGAALQHVSPTCMIVASAALAALGLVGVAALENAWLLAGAMSALGLGAAGLLTPTLAVIARLAEREHPPAYGSLYALYNLAYAAGLGIAPFLAGIANQALGFTEAAILAAAAAAAAAIGLLLTPTQTGATGATEHPNDHMSAVP